MQLPQDIFLIDGTFGPFATLLGPLYQGNKEVPKQRKLKLFKTIDNIEGLGKFPALVESAINFAAQNCDVEKVKGDIKNGSTSFIKDIKKGKGHRWKSAALHYYLLRHFPEQGKVLNIEFLGSIEIEGIFDRIVHHEPFAPFKWPPHISKEDAFPKKEDKGLPSGWLDGQWLNPHNHYAIPLSGREAEIERLEAFVKDDRPFLIGAVIAPSGAGKTRLISQWMRGYMAKYQENGWDAGFVESRDASPWREWEPTKNTIIIIDYTYNYGQVMDAIIQRFKSQSTYKIRLLMLDHILPDQLHEDLFWKNRYAVPGLFEAERNLYFKPIFLKPEKVQSNVLQDIIAAAANPYSAEKHFTSSDRIIVKAADALMKIGEVARENPTVDQIRSRNAVRHPLFAALVGQTLFLNPNESFLDWSRRDLFTHYFNSGQRIPWDRAEGQNLHADTIGPWVGCYVNLATLLRGINAQEMNDKLPNDVRQRLSDDDLFSDLIDYCNRIVSSKDNFTIKPFEPDILGEVFFLKFVERYANDSMLNLFTTMLSTFTSQDQEEKYVNSFLETLQRLVRNLINDDQKTIPVKKSWAALNRFLAPSRFQEHSLIRHAVSIAICDTIKQIRADGLDILVPSFVDQVDVGDLCIASTGVLWNQATTAVVNYHDWLASNSKAEQKHDEALLYVLRKFEQRHEKNWPPITLAIREGCLNTASLVRRHFKEGLNSPDTEGMSPLVHAVSAGQIRLVEWLLDHGADPDFTEELNCVTPLMIAALSGSPEIVQRLIKSGVKVDTQDTTGTTALMIASQLSNYVVVNRLLEAGAKTDLKTKDDGRTALMIASARGHSNIVNRLVSTGAQVNHQTTDTGTTALIEASGKGHLGVVDRLIRAGAKLNHTTTDSGWTALILASVRNHIKTVDCLIKAGAEINIQMSANGMTALIAASAEGNLEIVESLLKAGATIDQGTTDTGWTALMAASQEGHIKVVDALFKAGGAVNKCTTDDSNTALILAASEGHVEVVERLLAGGAAVDHSTTDTGTTALIEAAAEGHVKIVESLIKAGATIDQGTTNINSTALMLASWAGHVDVVEQLCNAGAVVNQGTSDRSWTALMAASQEGHAKVVDFLLKAGAAVNQSTTDNGETAIAVACVRGHLEITVKLIESGATPDRQTYTLIKNLLHKISLNESN